MDAGCTFLRADADRHLWVILSDPTLDPDNVLIVNLTSLDARKENVCVLGPGDHPWIRHETCVNYMDAVITTLAKLKAAVEGGALRLQDPMATEVLKKIRNGALNSERMAPDKADVLIDQGLVDWDL